MLTSKQNPRIKELELLRKKNRVRQSRNLFLVEGEREISRAGKLEQVYFNKPSALINKLEREGTKLVQVSKALLDRISMRGEIVGIGKKQHKKLEDLKGSFFVALVGVEKPGNIGAILRTCDGAGVEGVLLVDALADHYHPNAIRSSLGAAFSLDIVCCTSEEAFAFIEERELTKVITTPDAEKTIEEKTFTFPLIVALGQEDKGLPKTWLGGDTVSIPMKGICDSLNVSVAAGVVLYECNRQRPS